MSKQINCPYCDSIINVPDSTNQVKKSNMITAHGETFVCPDCGENLQLYTGI